MSRYLDENGLLYFWNKIKAALGGKVDKEQGKGLSTNDYTTAEKNKLAGIAAGANKYTHPEYTARSSGLYKVTVDNTGHVSNASAVSKSDITGLGIPGQDTTYGVFQGATTSPAGAGTTGLVPAPGVGQVAYVLSGEGKWKDLGLEWTNGKLQLKIGNEAVPCVISAADTENNGLMAAVDKRKLDSVEEGAEENQNAFTTIQIGDTTTKTAATGKESTLQLYTQANSGLDIAVTGDGMLTFGLSAATTSKQGAMSAADKTKLNALPTNNTLEATYAKKTDIASVYKYKGSVAAASNLPTTGQTKGDVYNIEAASSYGPAGTNVAWDGDKWDSLGGIFEIQALTNAQIDAICV